MNLRKLEKKKKATAHVDPEAWAKKVRTRRRVLGIVLAVLVLAGLLGYLVLGHFIPGLRYAEAERCLKRGETNAALELFAGLWTYKDANDRAAELAYGMQQDESLRETFRNAELGDIVSFGRYEQDGDLDNGPEPIEWFVLSKKDGRLLLWSVYALDARPMNDEAEEVTWADCSLRRWLNDSFRSKAFTDAELALIPKSTMKNENNTVSGAKGGRTTEDQIAVISYRELLEYGSANPKLVYVHAYPTEYAVMQGVDRHSEYGTCKWWMRTPGVNGKTACYCDMAGIPLYNSVVTNREIGVRPILWVLVDEN